MTLNVQRERRPAALSGLDVFHRLGERDDRLWADRNYDERIFPELCVDVLQSEPDLDNVSPLDMLGWIGSRTSLPTQHEAVTSFSDLSLTFYDSPRFHVGALLWLDGTTAIHQHSFSGAFRLLAGSSLQSLYRFDESRSVNRKFRLGTLIHEKAEILTTGSVHAIPCGEDFIHSLFHLDRPSLTLIIRTKHIDHRNTGLFECSAHVVVLHAGNNALPLPVRQPVRHGVFVMGLVIGQPDLVLPCEIGDPGKDPAP